MNFDVDVEQIANGVSPKLGRIATRRGGIMECVNVRHVEVWIFVKILHAYGAFASRHKAEEKIVAK